MVSIVEDFGRITETMEEHEAQFSDILSGTSELRDFHEE
jgi:hypothetical protein